jgi:hypothetical protein
MEYDKRRTDRRRVLKSGTIEFGAKVVSALPCTIRDFSETGAKLRLDSPLWFPDQVRLSSGDRGERRPCRVIWRDGRQVGVAFTDLDATV